MFSTMCYMFIRNVDPLKEGRSTWRTWPNRYLCRHRIMLCGRTPVLTSDMGVQLFVIERSYGVWLVLTTRWRNLVPMTSLCYGIRTLSVEPYCCTTCSFKFGCSSCADLIRSNFPAGLETLM
ncbi:hypothetical protein M9H77_08069 [Catharanthus roseus]|uniref:Uncharacterized protein n=1 Tax=Catharanthus roseus TaxID=4058 RepID=A0ACC0BWP4_CATRO|nr:hypothetical protein M9H77_08069 [Catharanthus roseus]